jgi:Ca2+-binding EF-hand superfamily protein
MDSWTVDGIFAQLDDDNSGLLSFAEFLVPSIDPMVSLNSNEKMWMAFKDIEINNKGYVTMADIKNVLSPRQDIMEDVWRKLLDIEDPDEELNQGMNIN